MGIYLAMAWRWIFHGITVLMFLLSAVAYAFSPSLATLTCTLFFGACVAVVLWDYSRNRALGNRLRQRVAGRCASCGYDMRASKDICPECSHRQSDERDFWFDE